MGYDYYLEAPRETRPLCLIEDSPKREQRWYVDKATFQAAWPLLRLLGYTVVDNHGFEAPENIEKELGL